MCDNKLIQLNNSITRQPVVFFLGAGASAPLGMPTTLNFRRILLKTSSKTDRQLVNALYESATNRYRIPADSINLERFLEFLHELRLGLWIMSRSNFSEPISPAIAELSFDSWAEVDLKINRVRWNILNLLHSVCGDCPAHKVADLWSPIFDKLREYTTVFPVFTLNYDWTFERLCIARDDLYKLCDGFTSATGGNWSAQHFSLFNPSQDKTDICLFKLHGSTCWVGDIKSLGPLDNSDNEPKYGFESEDSCPLELVYPGHQREVWLGDESWHMPGIDSSLFSTWRQEEPYSILYNHLDECLTNAKIVVVIGYAFGDNEINSWFANTFKKNRDVHFIVLNPGQEWGKRLLPDGSTQITYYPPYYWKPEFMDLEPEACNRLHWILGKFGTKTSSKKLITMINQYLK